MATFVAGNSAVNMLDQLTFNVDSFYTSPDETVDVADILNGNQYLYIKFSSSAATVITQAALYVPGTTVLGQFPTANDLVWSATGPRRPSRLARS